MQLKVDILLCVIMSVTGNAITEIAENDKGDILFALEQIGHVNTSTCTGGLETVLNIPVQHNIWRDATRTAIITSNFLSSIIQQHDGSLDSLKDEALFYDLVKYNVAGQSSIFGSAIALESGVYSKHDMFAPYAFHVDDKIVSFDPSVYFNYDDEYTEWYHVPKTTDRRSVTEIDTTTTIGSETRDVKILVAKMKDGHWTKPYFDCGAGNIWMMTFSSPIFGRNKQSGEAEFKGVSLIDIDLTSIDINQCDPANRDDQSEGDIFLGAFRGTHKCQPTTKCTFVPGFGFKRGGYECICENNYNTDDKHAFKGIDVENAHETNQDMTLYMC